MFIIFYLYQRTQTIKSYRIDNGMMDLRMKPELARDYKSRSQIARILTESWFSENMYCPACTSDHLDVLPNNTAVVDFICPECREPFQLKSQSKNFGHSVTNSEYYTKVRKIRSGMAPNWSLLRYDMEDLTVKDLLVIPRHFMTLDLVQKREPLKSSARRAGWTGSNVLIGELPPDARLFVVENGNPLPRDTVRRNWKRFEFLKKRDLRDRSWTRDVMFYIRELGKEEFSLRDLYRFEGELSKRHPRNRHIQAKIRQQLQVLRDENVLDFIGRGLYRLK